MSEDIVMSIEIPGDVDGFVLLKCEHCGTFFKCRPNDIESDEFLHIFCPSCGLCSDHYLSDDAIQLAMDITENVAMNLIYDFFKEEERKSKNSIVKMRAGSRPREKTIEPLKAGVDALSITHFKCCNRDAKIKLMLKMTGCYCPFCGVKEYETE